MTTFKKLRTGLEALTCSLFLIIATHLTALTDKVEVPLPKEHLSMQIAAYGKVNQHDIFSNTDVVQYVRSLTPDIEVYYADRNNDNCVDSPDSLTVKIVKENEIVNLVDQDLDGFVMGSGDRFFYWDPSNPKSTFEATSISLKDELMFSNVVNAMGKGLRNPTLQEIDLKAQYCLSYPQS